jgi:hypothetical protein
MRFRRLVMTWTAAVLIVVPVVTAAVASQPSTPRSGACEVDGPLIALKNVPEASGVAASRRTAGRVWVHNDSKDPVLAAVDANGTVTFVRVRGAAIKDWEDVAMARCGERWCLYIADIGDNRSSRGDITVYKVPEPGADERETAPAEVLRATYPDGAHDAEAFFVTSSGDMFIVTKEKPATLYQFPATHSDGAGGTTLQRIKTLDIDGKVTGAGATVDGQRVALRTHAALFVFRTADLVSSRATTPLRIDVSHVGEPQGEGVAFGPGGVVYLVGEGGGHGRPGTLARLHCTLGQ